MVSIGLRAESAPISKKCSTLRARFFKKTGFTEYVLVTFPLIWQGAIFGWRVFALKRFNIACPAREQEFLTRIAKVVNKYRES